MSFRERFSEKLNIIFYLTPKCGYSSFDKFQRKYREQFEFKRINPQEIADLDSPLLKKYVIVREPFERMVSCWLFIIKVNRAKYDRYKSDDITKKGFNAFLDIIRSERIINRHWCSQVNIFNKDFERIKLKECGKKIKEIFGQEYSFEHERKCTVENVQDYYSYYDKESYAKVKGFFQKDLEWLGDLYKDEFEMLKRKEFI